MRAASPDFLAAVRGGGRRVQRVYVKAAGGAWTEVASSGYRITADRSQVARYSGQVQLAAGASPALVEPYGSQVRVMSGFLLEDGEELVHVGTMRIDDVDTGPSGELTLSCFGLEKAVEDAQFRTPRIIQSNSIVAAIVDLLSITGAPVSVTTARDEAVPLTVYDTDRWKAVDGDDKSLARALGVEVYCDPAGVFIIRNIPTLSDPPVWSVNAGANGVLVDYRASATRAGVHNVVIAASDQAGYENVIIGVEDDVPASKTYVRGPFGEVVRQYRSPLLLTVDQALTAAAALLAESGGLARSLSLTQVPNPALEPGDVVTVVFPDGTNELHLLDRVDHASDGAQTADTRTTRAA